MLSNALQAYDAALERRWPVRDAEPGPPGGSEWYGTPMLYTTLIDAETLEAHLGETDFRVVDCRFNLQDPEWGAREYEKRHIPGAVFASIDDDLSGPKSGHNGRHPLPDTVQLATTLGRLGIDEKVQVVVYDQDAGMYASRLWWLLRWMGHAAVALLDGGFGRWLAESRPVVSGLEVQPTRHFVGAPQAGWVVTSDQVRQAVATGRQLLVDARAPERYRGEVEPVDKVAGRIAGAVNHPYQWNVMESGSFRPRAEVRQRLQQTIGDFPPDRVICYCGSGVTACLDLLAFEHAGLSGAKLYPGSWSEWLSDPTRPTERG